MCQAKPGTRCAADTCADAQLTLDEYIRAWPGGADVNPIAAVQAVLEHDFARGNASSAPAAPNGDALRARDQRPALSEFGDVDDTYGPFDPPGMDWNEPDPSSDVVTVGDRTLFRRRHGVYPGWPDAVRIEVGRRIDNAEMRRLAGIVAYTQRSELRGVEEMSGPFRDGPASFVMYQDATKTASDDYGMALDRFESTLHTALHEGTPVRKTDRSGAGTKGTRAVDGVELLGEVSIWYDDATDADGRPAQAPASAVVEPAERARPRYDEYAHHTGSKFVDGRHPTETAKLMRTEVREFAKTGGVPDGFRTRVVRGHGWNDYTIHLEAGSPAAFMRPATAEERAQTGRDEVLREDVRSAARRLHDIGRQYQKTTSQAQTDYHHGGYLFVQGNGGLVLA